MQGRGRRQGQSLAKSDNLADAASGLNPEGRVTNATALPLRSFLGQLHARSRKRLLSGRAAALRLLARYESRGVAAPCIASRFDSGATVA